LPFDCVVEKSVEKFRRLQPVAHRQTTAQSMPRSRVNRHRKSGAWQPDVM
jgi:hypothetical protein